MRPSSSSSCFYERRVVDFKHFPCLVIEEPAQLVSCAKIIATPRLNYFRITMVSPVNAQVLSQVFFPPDSLFPKEEDKPHFAATSAGRNTSPSGTTGARLGKASPRLLEQRGISYFRNTTVSV